MSEWLFAEAGQIENTDPDLWLALVSPRLHRPTDAFCASILRLRRFWSFAPHLMELVAAKVHAHWEVITDSGSTFTPPKDEAEFNKAVADEIRRRVEIKAREGQSFEQITGYNFDRSVDQLKSWAEGNPKIQAVLRGLLESQLILAWGAFETLSEDVWSAAIKGLSEFEKKGRFRTLDAIRESYKSLPPTSDWINEILADVCIRKLALVRHVLVHKSGVVDQLFLDDAKKFSWADHGEELNKPIRVDGRRVKELVNPVVCRAQQLIRATDQWIKDNNPQPTL